MKRPLAVCATAMIWGIILSDVINSLLWGLICIFISCIALSILLGKSRTSNSKFLWLVVPFLLLGFTLHSLNKVNYQNAFSGWEGKNVTVTGWISDEPQLKDGKIKLCLSVYSVDQEVLNHKESLSVTLYSEEAASELHYGSYIGLNGEIRIPEGKRNVGGFNNQKYLASKGISGTLAIPLREVTIFQGERTSWLKKTGYGIRNKILEALYRCLPSKEASVVAGMLIGYTDQMPQDMEESFRRAGLSHILAVSGANIAFLLVPLLWFFKRIGFNRQWSSAISLPMMLFFVFATGMEASVVRAAIMAGVTLIGMIFWRKTDVYCSLAATAILLLSLNTYMLFDLGFILSFLATLSLVMLNKPIFTRLPIKIPKRIRDTLAGTLAAQIGVVPVIAYSFNTLSVVSVLANLLVVPITGVLTLLGALVALFGNLVLPIGRLLGLLSRFLTDAMLWVTSGIASIPWAELHFATPAFILILAYYAVVLYLRYRHPRLDRAYKRPVLAALLVLCGLLLVFSALPSHKLKIYFTDVGQGDCILVKTPGGKNIIIDGGGSINDKEGSYAGERIVVPVLFDLNMTSIDLMVASHGHADHIAGLTSVMEQIPVKCLVVADAPDKEISTLIELAKKKGITVRRTYEGDVLYQENQLELKTLYPFKDKTRMPTNPDISANELSIVAKLDYGNFHGLLTGDIRQNTEQKLLDSLQAYSLVKIAHHGSRYSTSEAFLQTAQPQMAVISVGRNKYGHPDPGVVERLAGQGVEVFETLEYGGILVETDASSSEMLVKTVVAN
ncbi:MAG: DNA internalization-related competence protein ComEC/Rec2 [Clostridia bacterium]|nr:DNA internalization-related competence protein ComEC/Rec2 [Clostridia bacterium]